MRLNNSVKKNLVEVCRVRRIAPVIFVFSLMSAASQIAEASQQDTTRYKRIPAQYIAALAEPDANSGSGAETWGHWPVDPGPRGVWITSFDELEAAGGLAPAKWQFDSNDWWLDENGLIMEQPNFPVPAGKYVVTGGREVTTILTIHPKAADGTQSWELDDDAELEEVTHRPCRSARYTHPENAQSCTPANAQMSDFPVTPGAIMPSVSGCEKQDYAVLIVIGVAVEN